MAKASTWVKWTVEIMVDETWVAYGFELTDDRAHEMLAAALPFAHCHEIGVKVTRKPKQSRVKALQGYSAEAESL
jgi:hypothetical protein